MNEFGCKNDLARKNEVCAEIEMLRPIDFYTQSVLKLRSDIGSVRELQPVMELHLECDLKQRNEARTKSDLRRRD